MEKVAEAPFAARELRQLSRRTAYGRVAGLVAVLWGLEMFDQIIESFAPSMLWLVQGWSRSAATIAASGSWLLWLAYRHKRPWWQCLAAGLVAVVGLLALPLTSGTVDIPRAVVETAAEIVLVGAVARDAGISPRKQLGYMPRWAKNRAGRYQALEVFVLAVAGFIWTDIAAWVMGLIPAIPQPTKPQIKLLGYDNMADLAIRSAMAGPHEEVLLTAALTIFLLAARRPIWEIAIVAAVLRIIPHMYLGVPCLCVAIFAVCNVRLYARSRRIAPIVAAHMVTNIGALLAQTRGYIAGVLFLVPIIFTVLMARSLIEPKRLTIPRQRPPADTTSIEGAQ
jgi:hypothetical protein